MLFGARARHALHLAVPYHSARALHRYLLVLTPKFFCVHLRIAEDVWPAERQALQTRSYVVPLREVLAQPARLILLFQLDVFRIEQLYLQVLVYVVRSDHVAAHPALDRRLLAAFGAWLVVSADLYASRQLLCRRRDGRRRSAVGVGVALEIYRLDYCKIVPLLLDREGCCFVLRGFISCSVLQCGCFAHWGRRYM